MELIDLYVAEVRKRLPLKGRDDIEAELRSTLEDMLEDRSQKAGRPADEAMTLDLLKEYGPPDKVAATYNPHPYLIGPRLYPVLHHGAEDRPQRADHRAAGDAGHPPGLAADGTGPELAQAIVEGMAGNPWRRCRPSVMWCWSSPSWSASRPPRSSRWTRRRRPGTRPP